MPGFDGPTLAESISRGLFGVFGLFLGVLPEPPPEPPPPPPARPLELEPVEYEVMRAGYRALIKKHHPDTPETGDLEKTKELNQLKDKYEL